MNEMTKTERLLQEARAIAERAVGIDVEQSTLRAVFGQLCLERNALAWRADEDDVEVVH